MADAQGIAAKRLQSFIERIERLDSERQEIADQIKEVKAEAKAAGFDVKTINTILRRRKLTREELAEQDALLDTYEHAIGQLSGTPLGEAAAPKKAEEPVEDDEPGDRDDLKEEIIAEFQKVGLMAKSPQPPDSPPDPVQSALAAVRRQMQAAG